MIPPRMSASSAARLLYPNGGAAAARKRRCAMQRTARARWRARGSLRAHETLIDDAVRRCGLRARDAFELGAETIAARERGDAGRRAGEDRDRPASSSQSCESSWMISGTVNIMSAMSARWRKRAVDRKRQPRRARMARFRRRGATPIPARIDRTPSTASHGRLFVFRDRLQIAAREVEADAVAEHVLERAIDGDVAAAARRARRSSRLRDAGRPSPVDRRTSPPSATIASAGFMKNTGCERSGTAPISLA